MTFSQALELAKAIPNLLAQIYGDLAQPGVRQAGKAIETILGLGNTILLPVHILNERSKIVVEANFQRLRKKLEHVPEEKIVPVAPEVGVPLLEKFSQVADPSLADLYVGLLAKAATEEGCELVHPAFVKILDQLSPDEALLLPPLLELERHPIYQLKLELKGGDIRERLGITTGIEKKVKLRFPNNLDAYLSNLQGHGILQIKFDVWFKEEDEYKKLESLYPSYFFSPPPSFPDAVVKKSKGIIQITPFGKLFLNACLSEAASNDSSKN